MFVTEVLFILLVTEIIVCTEVIPFVTEVLFIVLVTAVVYCACYRSYC